jgi:hypothetical protein
VITDFAVLFLSYCRSAYVLTACIACWRLSAKLALHSLDHTESLRNVGRAEPERTATLPAPCGGQQEAVVDPARSRKLHLLRHCNPPHDVSCLPQKGRYIPPAPCQARRGHVGRYEVTATGPGCTWAMGTMCTPACC